MIKTLKYLLFSFVFLFFYSCIGDGHKKIVVRDPNGYFREEFIVINDSIKDGTYLKFYGNGKLWDSCFYKNDTLQGVRKLFTDDGNLEIKENYKDGILHGEYYVYYPNGNIKLLQYFNNNVMEDTSYAYFENGKLKEKVTFKNGLENGPFIEYYKNGNFKWVGKYLNGDNEQDTLYQYSDQGILIKKMLCNRGVCFTIWTKEKGEIKPDTGIIKKELIEMSENLIN